MGKTIQVAILPLVILNAICLVTVKCNEKWLTQFPDSKKLNTLAFIGTHDTAAYGTSIPWAQTQVMNIKQQLEAGVRVFDMRVRRTDNIFAMHHGPVFLGLMFGQLLYAIDNFLQKNPQEFVIMFMQEEHTAVNSDSECDILENKYMRENPGLFIKNWSVEDTIGNFRGKILLAKGDRGFGGCTTWLPCKVQNEYELKFLGYNVRDKLNAIERLQKEVSSSNQSHKCYINYLSLSGMGMAPAVLSGHRKMMHRVVSSETLGNNIFFLNIFHNPLNTLYIVMADYPNEELINLIVASNSIDFNRIAFEHFFTSLHTFFKLG